MNNTLTMPSFKIRIYEVVDIVPVNQYNERYEVVKRYTNEEAAWDYINNNPEKRYLEVQINDMEIYNVFIKE
jgi:predicted lipid carrier protein YhbT